MEILSSPCGLKTFISEGFVYNKHSMNMHN